MSNINRVMIYGDDNMEQLLNEMNLESTTTVQTYLSDYMSMSSQQPTSLSQLVVDEQSNYFNLTNKIIDDLIVYQSRTHYSSISVNESNIPIGESLPWTQDSVFDYVFAANRDEQSNHRIAHPSDAVENVLINLLSPVVIFLIFNTIWNSIPLSIDDTQPHTMVLPVFFNTNHIGIINNNENDDINEDATILNDVDDSTNNENINSTTIMIEHDNQMIVRESIGEQTIDDSTNDINPIISTDAQDNRYLDINNRVEQNIEYDNASEMEHQHNLNNDNDEREQVLLRLEHADEIHDNVQSNMPTAPSLPSIIESSEQVEEIEPLLAGPTDNNNHRTADPAHLLATDSDVSQLNAFNRKQSSPLNMNENAGEEENNHTSTI